LYVFLSFFHYLLMSMMAADILPHGADNVLKQLERLYGTDHGGSGP
jgi:hypothetical protein